jgi:hypothetical protein
VTCPESQQACDAVIMPDAGQSGFCRLFGLDSGDLMDQPVDPFPSQGLWFESVPFGVAVCTDHSEGLHGRINHMTIGVRSLARELMMVVRMLEGKVLVFPERGKCSAQWALQRLKEQARILCLEETNCRCQRDHIYSARFQIPIVPRQHRVLLSEPTSSPLPSFDFNLDARAVPSHKPFDPAGSWRFRNGEPQH